MVVLYFSHDGSRSWSFIDNLPIGQYYDISIDRREPYWVYGGTQDNGTWALPSRTYSELGITNNDVVNIAYGDGFYTVPDPSDPRTIYANSQSGRTYRVDLDTREERGIRPVSADPKELYRFNWSTPMLFSPHDAKVLYYGGNRLFRTADGGQRWEVISPDLTRNQDWKRLPVMGPIRSEATLSRDDGVSDFGTITTISESPVKAGLLYVGTDDGHVQMTPDGGKTWQNLTPKFKLPGERWVSRVLASRHGAGTAYVAFDGHQDDDFKPYVFRTVDAGATWSAIAARPARRHRCQRHRGTPPECRPAVCGDRERVVRVSQRRPQLDLDPRQSSAGADRRYRDQRAGERRRSGNARPKHHHPG